MRHPIHQCLQLAAILIGGASVSCDGGSRPSNANQAQQSPRLASLGNGNAGVVVVPLADSVRLGSAVRIAYLITGTSDSSRVFYHDPTAVFYEVTGPDGDTLRPVHWGEPGVLGELPRLNMPAGGIVGRVVDLTCIPIGLGPAGRDRAGACEAGFAFRERGHYTVRVRYSPYGRNTAGVDSAGLVSPPASIEII